MGQVTGPTSLKKVDKENKLGLWKRKLVLDTWQAYGECKCADCGSKKRLQLTKQTDEWKKDFYYASWVQLFCNLRRAGYPLKNCFVLLCRDCLLVRWELRCWRCKKEPRDRPDRKWCKTCRVESKARLFEERTALLSAYSNGTCACACCGEDFEPFLQLDHVNADGHLEKKAGLFGGTLYRHLRNLGYPDKHRYAVLCCNCNYAKHKNNNVCPCPTRRAGLDSKKATRRRKK